MTQAPKASPSLRPSAPNLQATPAPRAPHLTTQCRASWPSGKGGAAGALGHQPRRYFCPGPPREEGTRAGLGELGHSCPHPLRLFFGRSQLGRGHQQAGVWGRQGNIKAGTRPCPFVMQSQLGNDPASPHPAFLTDLSSSEEHPPPTPPNKSSRPPGQEGCECAWDQRWSRDRAGTRS